MNKEIRFFLKESDIGTFQGVSAMEINGVRYTPDELGESVRRLTEENKALLQWLDFATAYIAKAVADGQMEACAVPASLALGRLRGVLAKQP